MARLVEMRVSYLRDCNFLTLLAQAIEKDFRQSAEWKREVLDCITKLISLFMRANIPED